jgi:hypothetical protein
VGKVNYLAQSKTQFAHSAIMIAVALKRRFGSKADLSGECREWWEAEGC